LITLFLDQALPVRAEGILRQRGWDTLHATTAGMSTTPDSEILEWCREVGRVIVTHDHGFHQLIALADAGGPSVIRIRLQGLNHEQIASVIERVARAHAEALASGSLISVTRDRVKVRKLPLGTLE
jgi:predicted nuclease of predicted toxin-antitoxin system